ncbi:cytidine deaminase [Bryobacter aggregatus]|uniref:cytidine deaminase n=1 Tax=Bryobacter aggregatus TaxID=360054 RepID=UPI0004E26C8D|nr:cytidine deaminase [Bryobacter aggregatus]
MTLQQQARQAQRAAYAPYSHFKVGCAVETADGEIYTGCNVENASYGATLCAERVAITKAVSDGHRKFRRIAVATDAPNPAPPCGQCRQVMAEFCDPDVEVILCGANEIESSHSFGELLPFPFNQSSLL